MATSGTSADAGALPASEAPVDSALPRATAGPAGIVVRAYPRQFRAGGLTVASPPTDAGNVSSLAGWLQYLVPLVGSGGSLAFLFAVPGPRPAWLVALGIGAALGSGAAGAALRLAEARGPRRAPRPRRARGGGARVRGPAGAGGGGPCPPRPAGASPPRRARRRERARCLAHLGGV